MKSQILAKLNLPTCPGVYKFIGQNGEILYIGKATNLKERVKSYFNKDLINTRSPIIAKMVEDAETIEWQQTDTVLEAIILEVNLIKKLNPKYNTKEKDNKSYNYVCITKDEFPRVVTIRGRLIDFKKSESKGQKLKSIYGPYPSGDLLRNSLKIIRRIFPFLDAKTLKKDKYEFYKQLHLAPDVGINNARKKYLNNIKNIELFFKGEKTKILKSLEKEMNSAAKKMHFERALELKKQIFALTHINEVSLLKEELFATPNNLFENPRLPAGRQGSVDQAFPKSLSDFSNSIRIEAYDVAHLSGSDMVGAFVVIDSGNKNTDEYRTFNIRGFTSSNDAGALNELINRRLDHVEWPYPDMIVADGNDVQKNVIENALNKHGLNIPVVAVVKNKSHKAKAIIGDVDLINKNKKNILLANAEVHRFVLNKHIKQRTKKFIPQNLKNKL